MVVGWMPASFAAASTVTPSSLILGSICSFTSWGTRWYFFISLSLDNPTFLSNIWGQGHLDMFVSTSKTMVLAKQMEKCLGGSGSRSKAFQSSVDCVYPVRRARIGQRKPRPLTIILPFHHHAFRLLARLVKRTTTGAM